MHRRTFLASIPLLPSAIRAIHREPATPTPALSPLEHYSAQYWFPPPLPQPMWFSVDSVIEISPLEFTHADAERTLVAKIRRGQNHGGRE